MPTQFDPAENEFSHAPVKTRTLESVFVCGQFINIWRRDRMGAIPRSYRPTANNTRRALALVDALESKEILAF